MDAKIMAKILLAEDEQNIASFIRRGLQEFGHEVQVEHDGGTAWSMLQEGVFDLLVLDVIMPKMDGLSVMEKFSHNANVKKVPVFIVLSAIGQERITEDAFSLGADYYVLKPFDNTTLLNRIKHIRKIGDRRVREIARPGITEESGNRCDEYHS